MVINFRDPFSSCSLKYPDLKKNDLLKEYSNPKLYVNSFNSSENPSGASLNELKIPCKNPTSGCL